MAHFQDGDGINRYSSAQLADLTARASATLAPIRGAAWLGELEFDPTPKFDFYAYYGGEYAARTDFTYTNAAGHLVGVGYGSPFFKNSGCTTEGFPSSTATNSSRQLQPVAVLVLVTSVPFGRALSAFGTISTRAPRVACIWVFSTPT
jgi:hypothetical protein